MSIFGFFALGFVIGLVIGAVAGVIGFVLFVGADVDEQMKEL